MSDIIEQIPEVIELAGGLRVPTGNMIDAPTPEPIVAPEPIYAPEPEPLEPAYDPFEGIDLGFIRQISSDPIMAAEAFAEITRDYDNADPMDLYRLGWIAENTIDGAPQSLIEQAFQEHLDNDLYSLDPEAENYGLTPSKALAFMRTVENTRSAVKERQEQTRQTVEAMRGLDAQSEGFQPTAEQEAQRVESYRKELSAIDLGYNGLPQEIAASLDPKTAQEFKAKVLGSVESSPFLGLEEYFHENDGGLNVNKIVQDRFVVANHKEWIQKALEQGRSLGRAEMAKEYEGKLNPPAAYTPGNSGGNPNVARLPDGTVVPLKF